jgi:hypothetical protein
MVQVAPTAEENVKEIILLAVLGLIGSIAVAPAQAPVYHNGYVNPNGTYVQPHYQSAPDNNPYNNWSAKPNVNPYTGQPGTRQPNPYGR